MDPMEKKKKGYFVKEQKRAENNNELFSIKFQYKKGQSITIKVKENDDLKKYKVW